jgi:hypothetical protein
MTGAAGIDVKNRDACTTDGCAATTSQPNVADTELNLIQEIVMNVKKMIGAVIASVAIAPIAAFADSGDEMWQEQLASLKSNRTAAEVKADLAKSPLIVGQRYPVDEVGAVKSERSRAEVKAEVAKNGMPVIGA